MWREGPVGEEIILRDISWGRRAQYDQTKIKALTSSFSWKEPFEVFLFANCNKNFISVFKSIHHVSASVL